MGLDISKILSLSCNRTPNWGQSQKKYLIQALTEPQLGVKHGKKYFIQVVTGPQLGVRHDQKY